jgi:hypothetical protein
MFLSKGFLEGLKSAIHASNKAIASGATVSPAINGPRILHAIETVGCLKAFL